MDRSKLFNVAVQCAAAALVIFALYVVAITVVKQDALVRTEGTRQRAVVPLIPGSLDYEIELLVGRKMVATQGFKPYVHLPRSMNHEGGAQMTFTLWMKCERPHSTTPVTVFIAGDTKPVPLVHSQSGRQLSLPVAFCPMLVARMLSIDGAYRLELSAHVNTTRDFNGTAFGVVKQGIDFKKWNLVTVICSDGYRYGTEAGTNVTIMFNQAIIASKVVYGALVTNVGNITVLPGKVRARNPGGIIIRDMEYANYALNSVEVYDKMVREMNKSIKPYQPNIGTRQELVHTLHRDILYQQLKI